MSLTLSQLRARLETCPLCGPSLFIRFANDEMAVRCVRCRASPVSLSLIMALQKLRPDLRSQRVYELSSRGPVVRYLKQYCGTLRLSEYFDDVPPGTEKQGVRCEDIQQLTWPDESFDVCTSTEVFEHVPDDMKGFAEVRRVLRPNGIVIFTVPLSGDLHTVTRATLHDGAVEHLMPPEFHGDRIRGAGKVLAFRTYGRDILDRLRSAGFARAEFIQPQRERFFGMGREVVVGYR